MDPRKMMGYSVPDDKQVAIPVRDWNAMKLAMWRNKVGWDIVAREAATVLGRCRHLEGCPGENSETEPCLGAIRFDDTNTVEASCPDRELRMSALVVLNSARMFAPVNARGSNEQYHAPTREYFSEVMATLAATQAELDAVYAAGEQAPTPPANTATKLYPAPRAPALLSPAKETK